MTDLEKQFKENMDKSINNFNSVYPTFKDKINFLKELENNDNFIENHLNKDLLNESMELLVKNAKVTETRKMQQEFIMPILGLLFQRKPVEEVIKSFEQNPLNFTLFCITTLSFKFERTMKDHGETHHKNIIEVLDKYTSEISKL